MQCITSVAKGSHSDDTSAIPDMISQAVTQPATVRGWFHKLKPNLDLLDGDIPAQRVGTSSKALSSHDARQTDEHHS